MTIIVKGVVLWLIFFPMGLTFGQLYIRGKAGPLAGALLGAAIGAIGGVVVFWPNYQPKGAVVVATVAMTVIGATVLASSVRLISQSNLPLPPKK